MGDWSLIGLDILTRISDKLDYCEDYRALRGVCTWWRSATEHVHEPSPSRYVPWLMLPDPPSNPTRRFQGLDKRLVLDSKLTILASIRDWKHLFSSRGWIICVTENRYDIILMHPLSKKVIQPPIVPDNLSQFYDDNTPDCLTKFCKFALSDNPLVTSNYILCMIFPGFHGLVFWRSGDKEWTIVDYGLNYGYPLDVAFYNEEMYTVDCDGKVFVTGISTPLSTSRLVTNLDIIQGTHPTELYLVESSSVLFLIKRELCWDETNTIRKTCSFKVWEVNVESGEIKSVTNLRDKAVFVGYNNSCFSNVAFPAQICKPNCIYFGNHHYNDRGFDVGVYDLGAGQKIEDIIDIPSDDIYNLRRFSIMTSCLWVESSLMYPNYILLGC